MEHEESTTPLAVEINFLSELLRSNRQQHRAAKHFRLSCALVKRVGRLAPPPADNERAAAACDAAAAVALAAARGVREDLARGFFAALNACWLACLARVVELLRRDAAALRAAAAPASAAAAPQSATDDDDDLGEAVGRAADVDYSDSGSEDAGVAVPAFVDRTPTPLSPPAPALPPPAPAAPPLLPSPPETWTQKKRRKPTLPSHLRAKRRK